MRHGKKINHLGRTDTHRKAMLANMASSLIKHKRITTTLAKAKALRSYVEPLITKSKNDTTHSRRTVFSYLKDKETVSILFREVAEKVATRPGGYTRILKLTNRFGDNAEMALVELVDYNDLFTAGSAAAEKKSTRRRGGKSKKSADVGASESSTSEVQAVDAAEVVEAEIANTEVAEEMVAEVVVESPVAEEAPEPSTENEVKEDPEAPSDTK